MNDLKPSLDDDARKFGIGCLSAIPAVGMGLLLAGLAYASDMDGMRVAGVGLLSLSLTWAVITRLWIGGAP
jgi:hypothetical protein